MTATGTEAASSRPPGWALRLAAGVDAGAGAALAVASWFALHSRLTGAPWWAKFNLAAAPIYGAGVYWMGKGLATVAGAALLIALYTTLGILFAFLVGGRSRWRCAQLALLWMASWHIFAERYFWPGLDEAGPQYFDRSATVPAHLAAAVLLMRYPGRFRKMAELFAPAEVPVRPSIPEVQPETLREAEPAAPAGLPEDATPPQPRRTNREHC